MDPKSPLISTSDPDQGSGFSGGAIFSSHPSKSHASGTGDIILRNGPKPSKKLKYVILGIVGIVVVMILILIIIVIGSGDNNVRQKTKKAFLEYANFVLHGEISSRELDTSCVEQNNCYLIQALQSEEQTNAFFADSAKPSETLNKAVSAWNEKLTTSNEDSESDDAQIVQTIQETLELQEFIRIYSSRSMLKKSDIVSYYLQNGEDGTKEYIDNYYSDVGETNNSYLDSLREDIALMSTAVLENIGLYTKYGCMDEFMNEVCFITNATSEDRMAADDNSQIIAEYGSEMDVYVNMPYSLIDDIVKINALFNTDKQTEQQ